MKRLFLLYGRRAVIFRIEGKTGVEAGRMNLFPLDMGKQFGLLLKTYAILYAKRNKLPAYYCIMDKYKAAVHRLTISLQLP
ncbi:MAG: hypothetical protein LBQ88_23640 [Treponema sp.]|jgi:hypothetical protein|nr:hypothetical protein [Treponema sp.]